MFSVGPIDLLVALLLSVRRFGPGRTLLGAVGLSMALQPLLPPVPCGCFRPLLRRCDYTARFDAAMKSDLNNLASQQEIFRDDARRYSSDPEALGFVTSSGVTVVIEATDDAWVAWATHAALGDAEGCMMRLGSDRPSGRGRSELGSEAPDWSPELGDLEAGRIVCTT